MSADFTKFDKIISIWFLFKDPQREGGLYSVEAEGRGRLPSASFSLLTVKYITYRPLCNVTLYSHISTAEH